jgi:hypothetical protein
MPVGYSPDSEPLFNILDIQGLNPIKADVNTTSYGSVDGEFLTGTRVGKRNIVLTIGLNPDWADNTPSKLRRTLDAYFMTKQSCNLLITDDDLGILTILGIVESSEPSIFSKDMEQQVSLICVDPYFRSYSSHIINGNVNDPEITIDYPGNVDYGMVVGIDFVSGASPTHIEIHAGDTTFKLDGAIEMDSTHNLNVSSYPGLKYAIRLEETTFATDNLLHLLESDSQWLLFHPGSNPFEVTSDAGIQSWTLSYYDRYGSL